MGTKPATVAVMAAMIGFTSFALADAAPPAAAPPPTSAPSAVPEKDPVICKTEGTTGSRLGSTRVCATKSEWDRRQNEDRSHMENLERGGFTSTG